MSDDIDVSGGGTAVSTVDLEVASGQLYRLGEEVGAIAADLARLDPVAGAWSVDDDQARIDIEVAVGRARRIAGTAQLLGLVVGEAARGYVVTEQIIGSAVRVHEQIIAGWLGAVAPLRLLVGGTLFPQLTSWAVMRAAGVDKWIASFFAGAGIPGASPETKALNGLWTNPATVDAVRALAEGVGPFALGVAGAPVGASLLLGHRPSEFGATGLIAAGQSLGLLKETGVKLVDTTSQAVVAPPRDYVDRLARVPYQDDGSGPQVRVERYSVEGGPDRFAVYVSGTATFSPAETTEPWDMTSNMFNAAGGGSGSVAAVREAMAVAGVTADSPVQLTGYSQGGGVVARIASSGDYAVQGITTFGGPTGNIPLPHGIPAVLVEHSDDLVPALGGEQGNTDAVLVRRDVYGDREMSKEWAVPAHHIENYIKTAHLMDTSGSPQLDAALEQLDSFTAGATLESSTLYRFERTEG